MYCNNSSHCHTDITIYFIKKINITSDPFMQISQIFHYNRNLARAHWLSPIICNRIWSISYTKVTTTISITSSFIDTISTSNGIINNSILLPSSLVALYGSPRLSRLCFLDTTQLPWHTFPLCKHQRMSTSS